MRKKHIFIIGTLFILILVLFVPSTLGLPLRLPLVAKIEAESTLAKPVYSLGLLHISLDFASPYNTIRIYPIDPFKDPYNTSAWLNAIIFIGTIKDNDNETLPYYIEGLAILLRFRSD